MASKTTRLLNKIQKRDSRVANMVTPIATDMVLPNHSGTKREPTLDREIATKKYVDDHGGSGGLPSGTHGDILYYNGSNWVVLGAGTSGQLLKTYGIGSNPAWDTVSGSGDVSKVGTPVNNQVGVWTGDGTIEGNSNLTWDASKLQVIGVLDFDIPDNTAAAFSILQGSTGYMCCDTTNGSEAVKLGCGGANPIAEITSTGLEVTGNITLSGNVDGIDIATDVAANTAKISFDSTSSTKLSGIETGAEVNAASDHTQNTDTSLGSGCVAADHGTASTDQVVNVCYGTSATPPTASTTTEGTLYIQYTA